MSNTEIVKSVLASIREAEGRLSSLDLRTFPAGPPREVVKSARAALKITRQSLATVR